MGDWEKISELCEYLEQASCELDETILKTKREASKLQDIFEAISPLKVTDPREEKIVTRSKAKFYRGFDNAVTPQVAADPYGDFLHCLNEYKKLPAFPRERISHSFVKRIMDFSRLTPLHLHSRMIPCLKVLIEDIDKANSLDITQPNQRFRLKHIIEQGDAVLDEYDRLIKEFGLFRRCDVIAREKEEQPKKIESAPKKQVDAFETIANLTPKQLNEFYHLRGTARQAQMTATIKERTASAFTSFLQDYNDTFDEDEKLDYLKASARAFQMLTNSKKHHAIVLDKHHY